MFFLWQQWLGLFFLLFSLVVEFFVLLFLPGFCCLWGVECRISSSLGLFFVLPPFFAVWEGGGFFFLVGVVLVGGSKQSIRILGILVYTKREQYEMLSHSGYLT